MTPGLIFLIIVFSLVLIKSADLVIVAIRRISKESQAGIFTVSAVILALGTSFPELFVGITSAIAGTPNLLLGVVLGSNIANLALVTGISGLLVGKIKIRGDYLKRDVWVAFLAGILPLFLILDKSLSRVDGLILLATYFAYSTGFFRRRYVEIGKEQAEESFVYRFLRKFNNVDGHHTKEFGRLFVGVALLLFSSDMIVRFSTRLASQANIPIFLVGLVVLAIGTSLPELAFSLRSLGDHEPSMFFGNLLGSTIANSTLVLGVVSIIAPIEIVAFNEYVLAAIAFLVVFASFWAFIRSKHRLDRWEAGLLLLFYFSLLVLEFA